MAQETFKPIEILDEPNLRIEELFIYGMAIGAPLGFAFANYILPLFAR